MLLSLIPPSCMVAPIRELANIQFSTSALNSKPLLMANLPSEMDMDVDCNIIRGRSTSSSKASSRNSSVTSNVSSIPYYERMEINNNLPDEDLRDPIDSSQLSYKDDVGEGNSVRKAADNGPTKDSQRVQNEASALKNTPKPRGEGASLNSTNMSPSQNTINIQLPYNPNQATEHDLWDGTFQSISLHSSLEHLPSDAKNIRELLCRMAKYIENKKIDVKKSNEVSELRGIGEATWKFLSAIYNSGWDSLIANKDNNPFRQKVAFKFTPKVNLIKTNKKGEKNTDKPASIERLSPPIPAKLPKEIKEISKFSRQLT